MNVKYKYNKKKSNGTQTHVSIAFNKTFSMKNVSIFKKMYLILIESV